ncbi:hypothetical protein [Nakamurella sp.]|uniref:hypothetical protein n=1 Tax=Nakamurella sp. TaxID=1869182 RepID=UPI003783F494
MFLLIAHFEDGGSAGPAGPAEPAGSTEAVGLLGEQPATRSLRWARSTEEPHRWVLVAEFDTAADFRRAQSPFPVRAALIPWLAGAASSAAFEVVSAADRAVWSAPEVIVDDPGR